MELVMTVVIIGIVLTQIYSLLGNTLKASNATENLISGSDAIPSLIEKLSSDIRETYTDNTLETFFVGESSRLHFLSNTPYFSINENGDISYTTANEISYYTVPKPSEADKVILVRRIDTTPDKEVSSGGEVMELHNNLKSIEFNYLEFKDGTTTTKSTWVANRQDPRLPNAVVVKITLYLAKTLKNQPVRERSFEFKIPLRNSAP